VIGGHSPPYKTVLVDAIHALQIVQTGNTLTKMAQTIDTE